MLDSWLPFLIYGILALAIPASMLGMSFWFSQKPARRTRARTVPFESGVSMGPLPRQRVRLCGRVAKTKENHIMDAGIASAKIA